MARTALVDTGFLVALLRERDEHRAWAESQAAEFLPPWFSCEAVLSEAFHLLATPLPLLELVRDRQLIVAFEFSREQNSVLQLMERYADLPMSLADACLVRMTEIHPGPVVLTTDTDFRIYRRHSRQVVPCVLPD